MKRRGVSFESLEVVVVPFPFTDRLAAKRRPALIVSSANFNRAHRQSILTMITSARGDWPSDVAIRDWRQAGLDVPCKVRFKLFTLDDSLIVRKLWTLSRGDGEVVREALGRVLAASE
jgi:mRNA interferase MazF